MSSAEDIVLEFFKRMETCDYQQGRAAFAEMITDDCHWANSGFPTAEGKDACLAMWDGFNQALGFAGMRVDMVAMASKGGTVVTERVDHLINSAGETFMSLPLAGTLEVRDGKISGWRDYRDPRPLVG